MGPKISGAAVLSPGVMDPLVLPEADDVDHEFQIPVDLPGEHEEVATPKACRVSKKAAAPEPRSSTSSTFLDSQMNFVVNQCTLKAN